MIRYYLFTILDADGARGSMGLAGKVYKADGEGELNQDAKSDLQS